MLSAYNCTMNRTTKGQHLTEEDLLHIARSSGVTEATISGILSCHNQNMIMSKLSDLTREARHRMWAAGHLVLDTR